jgi:ferritin-like metal-binding protein YciE
MTNIQELSRELLISDTRTLHAIQKNAKAMMKRVIDRLDDYPAAKERLQAHLGDKDKEMQRLEKILGELGEETSALQDSTMSMMGSMTGAMTAGLEDDILQTSMVTFGLASYEICAYEGMIELAQKAGETRAVPLLKSCLEEERAMAAWLHDHMSETQDRYLALRSAKGRGAAH